MWEQDFEASKAILSKNIKSLRHERGIAQERLGLESGVDRTLVSKIERQIANPSLEILTKIAAQLQVTVTELLTKKNK
jgi:transcriptional regulator with XRE-family HTH domain